MDEIIRRLEREAATGDPSAALELSRAQLRAGKPRLALEAAWLACAEPRLRHEVTKLTFHGDLPLGSPVIDWETRISETQGGLVAGPLSIRSGPDLLDPRTGQVRASLSRLLWSLGDVIVSPVVIAREAGIEVHDAWTGESRYRGPLAGEVIGGGPGVVVTRHGRQVVAHSLDFERPPTELWRLTMKGGRVQAQARAGTVALAQRQQMHTVTLVGALDGAVRSTITGLRWIHLDDEGLLGEGRVNGRSTLSAFDLGGRPCWQIPSDDDRDLRVIGVVGTLVALGRSSLKQLDGFCIDRITGTVTGSWSVPIESRGATWFDGLLLQPARNGEVTARSPAGELVWSWRPKGRKWARPPALASLPGRVFVAGGHTVWCLRGAEQG